ncbi:MAG: hypothetical protein VYE22_38660 [Myxococcota bacterium]|nr:hypothetical protein [Myxococcota bacterium]
MSSFRHRHRLYLFALRSGGRKLSWGKSAEDALEVLRLRLTPEEEADVQEDDVFEIPQRQMQKYVHLLR